MLTTRNLWTSPLERMYALQREIDRAFGNGFTLDSGFNGDRGWVPPMDVVETDSEVLCHLEVPGMKPEDIEISVRDNMLTISGEKKLETTEEKEGGYRSVERRYGRFERSFTLPRSIDANAVTARHENGVLTLVLPKVEESRPRRIQIEGTQAPRELNEKN